ncbi:slipin family protein [Candidatus Desantisbacteria bacterium]|nr:slipin family protein [Candidatus Desantisbacteria bacterium]
MSGLLILLIIVTVIIVIMGIRIVDQWQKGVVFRLGKLNREINPGFNVIIPGIEYVKLVDMRVRTMDVVPQEIMTKDSVPIKIDAVVYYKIFDAAKSIIAVDNFNLASTLLAQSKLRDVLGKYDLDTLLSNKDQIGKEVLDALQSPTDVWGINIISVEIKNIEIPDNMKRAMAKEAEAMREKRARIVKASAEEEASKKLTEAAKIISESPNALILRQLQTWQEIGSEQNSLIILVPTEFAQTIKSLQVEGKKITNT